MTTETLEPITTIEPILGLGEDYEPEMLWTGIQTAPKTFWELGTRGVVAWENRPDAESCCKPETVGPESTLHTIELARAHGFPNVVIVDGKYRVLSVIPV